MNKGLTASPYSAFPNVPPCFTFGVGALAPRDVARRFRDFVTADALVAAP